MILHRLTVNSCNFMKQISLEEVLLLLSFLFFTCPLSKFEGGLTILHEAGDDAVNWLNSVATTALAK